MGRSEKEEGRMEGHGRGEGVLRGGRRVEGNGRVCRAETRETGSSGVESGTVKEKGSKRLVLHPLKHACFWGGFVVLRHGTASAGPRPRPPSPLFPAHLLRQVDSLDGALDHLHHVGQLGAGRGRKGQE